MVSRTWDVMKLKRMKLKRTQLKRMNLKTPAIGCGHAAEVKQEGSPSCSGFPWLDSGLPRESNSSIP